MQSSSIFSFAGKSGICAAAFQNDMCIDNGWVDGFQKYPKEKRLASLTFKTDLYTVDVGK